MSNHGSGEVCSADAGAGKSGRMIELARRILNNWARLQGHEKCWHHPEILMELCDLFEVDYQKHPPCLPERHEFREGCTRYEAVLYDSE